ncbi:major facilitator superfamily domain-containing protein [Mycena galopus ATCC 62051]|nr:major facilitator superfamily domain-containing protein [Mycena galopus ATCC 62051]
MSETIALPGGSIELDRRSGRSQTNQESQEPHTRDSAPDSESQIPDGGYGWVVVFACAVLAWWSVGTSYNWGLIQAALVKQGLSSPSTLSFVGSLTVACVSGLAIINARVIRFFGARRTALAGISLVGLGEILSSFATKNIGALFVTTGIITGIGTRQVSCGCVASVMPAQYFTKRRGLANGVAYAGGGLGGAVTSFVMNALIQSAGVPWTFRIMGLLTLGTGLPAAWLIKERTTIRTAGFIEWSLFHDFRFIVLFFAGAFGTFPLFVPPFFLPLYSASLGLSPSVAAGLVGGFNFASALGRLGFGFASDRIGPVNVLLLALILTAISMLAIWPVSTSLAPLIVFVVINGVANGGFFSMMPTVVGAVFGSARVSVTLGMIVTGWVGGYLMGAPIAGYLLNAYGGADGTLSAYHPAMFYAGSIAMGAAALVFLVRLKASTNLFKKI